MTRNEKYDTPEIKKLKKTLQDTYDLYLSQIEAVKDAEEDLRTLRRKTVTKVIIYVSFVVFSKIYKKRKPIYFVI